MHMTIGSLSSVKQSTFLPVSGGTRGRVFPTSECVLYAASRHASTSTWSQTTLSRSYSCCRDRIRRERVYFLDFARHTWCWATSVKSECGLVRTTRLHSFSVYSRGGVENSNCHLHKSLSQRVRGPLPQRQTFQCLTPSTSPASGLDSGASSPRFHGEPHLYRIRRPSGARAFVNSQFLSSS